MVRVVTCQYDRRPHPVDDECVNVTDVEIRTRADFDLWLDGYDTGAATVLRTLADVPADKLSAVVASLAERSQP